MKRVGILYHPKLNFARALCQRLSRLLEERGISQWSCAASDDEVRQKMAGTDLVIGIGGDGTLLRAARAVLPYSVPILGVNVGRLGFMAEMGPDEVIEKLPQVLSGAGWVDERTTLQAELMRQEAPPETYHALNDVVVGRGFVARVIYVEAVVDDVSLTTYKGDGIIVATATGSTGYALAAGGPILYPQAREILVQPISPHLATAYSLVLPSTAVVELKVSTDHQAVLSIDGQTNLTLNDGDRVRVKLSPYVVRFLRLQPAATFHRTLTQKLRTRETWQNQGSDDHGTHR